MKQKDLEIYKEGKKMIGVIMVNKRELKLKEANLRNILSLQRKIKQNKI